MKNIFLLGRERQEKTPQIRSTHADDDVADHNVLHFLISKIFLLMRTYSYIRSNSKA